MWCDHNAMMEKSNANSPPSISAIYQLQISQGEPVLAHSLRYGSLRFVCAREVEVAHWLAL